ncbi:MAG: WecB/TagA/CpsF family glycosyltransferase [Flavisolibacter sp.]
MKNDRIRILSLDISSCRFDEALEEVKDRARHRSPSYVCFANVHMVVEAHHDPVFAQKVNNATLTLPDGVPLVKAGSILHGKRMERIAGMDFMPRLIRSMNQDKNHSYKIFFYGSTPEVLEQLKSYVEQNFSGVKIAGFISPPFRPLSEEETEMHMRNINDSGAEVVFVGLGCPKQENWMAANYRNINAVLLGVGGAFLTTAGLQKRAPRFMQKAGLEWFYRLQQEPRRLFKRYLKTNSRFVALLMKETAKKFFYGRK